MGLNSSFTMEQLQKIIRKGKSTTLGIYGIKMSLFKNLKTRTLTQILEMYNAILEGSKCNYSEFDSGFKDSGEMEGFAVCSIQVSQGSFTGKFSFTFSFCNLLS